jgi:hypothetical protein
MKNPEVERVRKINATKAHGHIDSAVAHCAYLLDHIDLLNRQQSELRRRIHFAEKHNQHFERCESAWCHPSADNDPAKEAADGREQSNAPWPPGKVPNWR